MIVENALRQFSQDRTGLADYALESGGESNLLSAIIRLQCEQSC